VRTTLTLDDDVADKLKALAEQRRVSFKEVVNDALRRGLATQSRAAKPARPFRVVPFASAFRPGVDPEKLNQLTDEIEVQDATDRIRASGAR
jgi:CTP:molybdopterin cytidylyltransferase MocA